jgi:hypothetical protein
MVLLALFFIFLLCVQLNGSGIRGTVGTVYSAEFNVAMGTAGDGLAINHAARGTEISSFEAPFVDLGDSIVDVSLGVGDTVVNGSTDVGDTVVDGSTNVGNTVADGSTEVVGSAAIGDDRSGTEAATTIVNESATIGGPILDSPGTVNAADEGSEKSDSASAFAGGALDMKRVKALITQQFNNYFFDCVAHADTFTANQDIYYNDIMSKDPQATDRAGIIEICLLTENKISSSVFEFKQFAPGGNGDYGNVAVIFTQTVQFVVDEGLEVFGLSGKLVTFDGTIVQAFIEEREETAGAYLRTLLLTYFLDTFLSLNT